MMHMPGVEQLDDLGATGDTDLRRRDRLNMLSPALKSLPHLGLVFRAIVDPRDPRSVAAHVI